MLTQLYLKNYALFAEVQIAFPAGLNILTGETGAGKSLLVGALGLILGKRADNSVVFMADDKCVVEARFGQLDSRVREALAQYEDFEWDDDELIVRREIRPNGKSRAFINDSPVPLHLLREVASQLVDLHSQHENQLLLSHEKQLELLDAFAGNGEALRQFQAQLQVTQELQGRIRKLEKEEAQAREQLDYYRFQVQELEAADIKADEEETLESELNLLQNAEEVRESLGMGTEALYEADDSLYGHLSEVLGSLHKIAHVNGQISDEISRLEEAREIIKEAAYSFRQMLDTVESDPERLAFIEERLAMYHKLKLKYNVGSGQELVERYQEFLGRIDAFDSLEVRIGQLRKELRGEMERLRALGLDLEARRQAAAGPLAQQVMDLLAEVGFQKARFEVALARNLDPAGWLEIEGDKLRPGPQGLNHGFFLIQTNPGMPAGPLAQIASGGEISRVMLALKAALAGKFSFPVLIFDEIDTGISGETAHKVGTVMQRLARRFQILSITHLPQIAARGDAHFEIRKTVGDAHTVSGVVALDREARVQALARMISGEQPTESALRNAADLMARS